MFKKLKFPASAMELTKEMIKIATFDIIPTDTFDELLWYFPEGEAFSAGFETAGVESLFLLENIGPIIYIFYLSVLFGVLHFLLRPCAYLCACCKKVTDKMGRYFYFNGSIRFYMEIFFDVVLLASLNLQNIDWNTPFMSEQASNVMSIVLIDIVIFFTLVSLLVSWFKPEMWLTGAFMDKCGAIFDDLRIRYI